MKEDARSAKIGLLEDLEEERKEEEEKKRKAMQKKRLKNWFWIRFLFFVGIIFILNLYQIFCGIIFPTKTLLTHLEFLKKTFFPIGGTYFLSNLANHSGAEYLKY